MPCSVSHNSPVVGLMVRPSSLRCPYDQISGSALSLPMNGLPGAGLPSGVMRIILPRWLSSFWARSHGGDCDRSPIVTNRLPSRAMAIRPPAFADCRFGSGGLALKITLTSFNALAVSSKVARATTI